MSKQIISTEILTKESFLVIDNAPDFSEEFKFRLDQIFRLKEMDFEKFKYNYVCATSIEVIDKITKHTNILVNTTFTTIKSNAVEDLIEYGVKYGLKDKNVFSLMQFSIVGGAFEDYRQEISQLSKNGVLFYFLNDKCESFDLYQA